jgi:hypothetical protein
MIKRLKVKRIGRPPTGGRKQGFMVRLHAIDVAAINEWRAQQPDAHTLTMPEALRRLARLGLAAAKSGR